MARPDPVLPEALYVRSVRVRASYAVVTTYAKSAAGGQRVPRAYLDTCLVIGMRKQDLGAEQEPLRRILHAGKQGRLALVTSHVTQKEIQRGRSAIRDVDEVIYLLLTDVPVPDEETLVPRPVKAGPGLFGPVVVTHQDLGTLRAILPDENDASHLFQAISNGVELLRDV